MGKPVGGFARAVGSLPMGDRWEKRKGLTMTATQKRTVQHAPAPWRRMQDKGPVKIVSQDGWRTVAIIADYAPDDDQRIAEANARLIEAAPDLVETLDNVTAIVETMLAHYGKTMPVGDLLSRTRISDEARKLVDSLLRK